jgi:hypothetical protein
MNSRFPQDFIYPTQNNAIQPRRLAIMVPGNLGLKRGDFLVAPVPADPTQSKKFEAAAEINDIYGVVLNTQDVTTDITPIEIKVVRNFDCLMAYCQTLPEDMSGAGNAAALAQRLFDINIGFYAESNSVLGAFYPDGVVWNGDKPIDATHQQPTAEVLGAV